MYLKRVTLNNYQCYYGEKTFHFSKGLNVVLGENGEGKTKLFEAIYWLFEEIDGSLKLLASKKALEQAPLNEIIPVSVEIEVEKQSEGGNNIYTIKKEFTLEKKSKKEFTTSKSNTTAIEENSKGERSKDNNGKAILKYLYPTEVLKYTMFKGESELNIFKDTRTLSLLVKTYSDAKKQDEYPDIAGKVLKKSEDAITKELSKHKREEREYNKIEFELNGLIKDRDKILEKTENQEKEIFSLQSNIGNIENSINNAKEVRSIKEKIDRTKENKTRKQSQIDRDYTVKLFDEKWLLCHFDETFNLYKEKVNQFEKERRKQNNEYQKKIGQKQAIKVLEKMPLPHDVPPSKYMKEMLEEEWCKVCNREAKKGTDAHEAMLKKLKYALEHEKPKQLPKEETPLPLFVNNHFKDLDILGHKLYDRFSDEVILNDINELRNFNKQRNQEVQKLNEQINELEGERTRIVGTSKVNTEDDLLKNFDNYTYWVREEKSTRKKHENSKSELEKLNTEIERKKEAKNDISKSKVNESLQKVNDLLKDLVTVFSDTKKKLFNEFIEKLETKSNEYFGKINIEAFTGKIQFRKLSNDSLKLQLIEKNGDIFHSPNTSLETSMHIAVLFGILEIVEDVKKEKYPMIFDAPISSFGETKSTAFLNLLNNTSGQKILLVKDYLALNKDTQEITIKDEFSKIKCDKAFWVKLTRPFDKEDLSTIDTIIETL